MLFETTIENWIFEELFQRLQEIISEAERHTEIQAQKRGVRIDHRFIDKLEQMLDNLNRDERVIRALDKISDTFHVDLPGGFGILGIIPHEQRPVLSFKTVLGANMKPSRRSVPFLPALKTVAGKLGISLT